MKSILLLMALLVTTTAHARDRGIQGTMEKCLSLPAGVKHAEKFVMSVKIDGKGEPLDIRLKEYRQDPLTHAIAEHLKRAILRCAPYDVPAGDYRVVFDRHMFDD